MKAVAVVAVLGMLVWLGTRPAHGGTPSVVLGNIMPTGNGLEAMDLPVITMPEVRF